jgi:hypothetical protein
MKLNSRKIVNFFGLFIAIALITIAVVDTNKREKSINDNKYETIGEVYKFNSNKSFRRYYYIYYFKGVKYFNDQDLDEFGREECIGRYYKINLSSKNPEYSKIFLDQEVMDSTEIVNAGFKYK